MQTNTLGCIVGRFQVADLHAGHQSLLLTVAQRHKFVLVVLGTSPARTNADPLDFITREQMVRRSLMKINNAGRSNNGLDVPVKFLIVPIPDMPDNRQWVQALDQIVRKAEEEFNTGIQMATLYGSRDSFLPTYHGFDGQYMTETLDETPGESGTQERAALAQYAEDSVDFRHGVIYGAAQRYPTSYQAVDIAIVDGTLEPGEPLRVLMARRSKAKLWRFPGGFVDPGTFVEVEGAAIWKPGDASLEEAAMRETKEETGLDVIHAEYLGSFRIDDWRYRKGPDKIMSALFLATPLNPEAAAGADDVAEVKWFDGFPPLEEVTPEHLPLMWKLISRLSGLTQRHALGLALYDERSTQRQELLARLNENRLLVLDETFISGNVQEIQKREEPNE